MKKPKSVDTDFLEPEKAKIPEPQRIAALRNGMVATAHCKATEIGARILSEGGNAVDAAVAAAFALGVCEPQASGLGGQTMMLIHLADEDRTFALDGSSRAPNRAVNELFADKQTRLSGHSATTVPSTPATLGYALKSYGTLPLKQILAPVIELAREGYQITALQRRLQRRELKALKKFNGGSFFLNNGERPCSVGTIFTQPLLAETFQRLADKGVEDFYNGDIAECIVRDMENNGGLLHRDDLSNIPYPIERETVNCRFGNLYVDTMPPPGAGRPLIEMLNILKKFPPADRNPDTPEGALMLAEIMRRAQLDRRDRPFDPSFYPQVQDRRMLSSDYARLVSDQVRTRLKTSGETTHLSVMDKAGNVVSLTQSIERVYGSKVVSPELGFLYNNYMSAFEYEDMSHPYYLRPNGVPWASVAPTIIFKSKKPWLAIGSPGSERIISTIAQVIIRLARQSPFDAVAAPRMHCAFDGKVSLEAACMRNDIPDFLRSRGFTIDVREPMSFYLGCVQMVLQENEEFIGVADPRRDGSAAGGAPMTLPVLLSVPHAGLSVPPEVSDLCLLSEKEIREDGDGGAAEIYYPLKEHVAAFVTTDVARAILDMNRAEDDRRKDGIVKTHTCWEVPVYSRVPAEETVAVLLERHYRPYHAQLTGFAKTVKIGIDCHTMAADGPPVGPDPGCRRPHVCLSNAEGACPQEWIEIFRVCFEAVFKGEVLVNHPFKGGYITRSHAHEMPWMQVELSRAPFLSLAEKSSCVLEALRQAFKLLA